MRKARAVVTMSAGVAALRGISFTADDILKLADDALYRSKERGQNASVLANTGV